MNLSSHGKGNGMDPCDGHRGDGEINRRGLQSVRPLVLHPVIV